MQKVPNIVRDRLKAAQPAVNHPDADLLTAFSEQSLSERERNVVLDHLARCADCRDVIALALPATETLETAVRPARSPWLTWPALRWGFVAAGVVVIASLGILQYQRHAQQSTMMALKSPAIAVPESRPQTSAPAQPPPVSQQSENQDKAQAASSAFANSESGQNLVVEPKPMARAAIPPAATQGHAFHGAVRGIGGGPLVPSSKMPTQWAQNNNIQMQVNNAVPAPAPSQPGAGASAGVIGTVNGQVPAAAQKVEVTGAAPLIAGQDARLDALKVRDQPATPSSSGDNSSYAIGKAKLPVSLAAPGQIGGYVVDPTGAVVPNARITIIPASGGTATTVTNSQGAWLIAGLQTGTYKAQAEAPGFKTDVLAFNFDANHPSTYRFTLSPGSVSETVEVAAAPDAQVQTESASIGNTMNDREVSQIGVNGRNFTQLTSLSPGLLPRWTIGSSGSLQRSLDQGKSWQKVDVNAGLVSSASLDVVAQESRAKQKDLDKKAIQRNASAPVFRAVTATGSEVWAGGSGGALYHSLDAGGTWIRVVASTANSTLGGDIVGLEFPDSQHGKITTSTSEIWTTSDGGQTWLKQ